MELKDIKAVMQSEILDKINLTGKGLIYRQYETFLDWFGMRNKRNFEILKKVDYQLKKNNIHIYSGTQQVNSVADISRGETITFRLKSIKNKMNNPEGVGKTLVPSKNAGTIPIENSKSDISLYKHQEVAIENLNNKIL